MQRVFTARALQSPDVMHHRIWIFIAALACVACAGCGAHAPTASERAASSTAQKDSTDDDSSADDTSSAQAGDPCAQYTNRLDCEDDSRCQWFPANGGFCGSIW